MYKKSIAITLVLLLLTSCSRHTVYYHEYSKDTVRTILSDEHKNVYTFVGDTNTYFFQDNTVDKNLTEKMTFMFELIENAKSWELACNPEFKTYIKHDSNQTRYDAVISLNITPSDEQLAFFEKVSPGYKENFWIGMKKATNYVEVVEDIGGHDGANMKYIGRWWWKDSYTFNFYFRNVTKALTTEEIKKRLSKYLLTKPIPVSLIGPQKQRIEDNEVERVLLPIIAIPMILAVAIVAIPVGGLYYVVNHDSKK